MIEQGSPADPPNLPNEAAVANNLWAVGPLGQMLYRENLPARHCQWTSRRKAEAVAAFAGGLTSAGELNDLYGLSIEELAV
jgi:hypothetical protein